MMQKGYYSTKEVLRRIGVSRNTIFLWFKHHKIPEVRRDRNGHRIFTSGDIRLILNYKNKVFPPKEN
jgi:DNA-binding transcriptional MerR regulator